MEGFCGEPLLSLSSSWNTSSPTLSQCLSRTVSNTILLRPLKKDQLLIRIAQVLLVPPSVILLLSILSSLYKLKKHVSSTKVILNHRQYNSFTPSNAESPIQLTPYYIPQEKLPPTSLSIPILIRLFLLLLALVSLHLRKRLKSSTTFHLFAGADNCPGSRGGLPGI